MSWIILGISLLIVFALSSLWGWSEAMYYYYLYKGKAPQLKRYEHTLWTVIRTLSYLPIAYIWFTLYGWTAVFGVAAMGLMFFFFHDSIYYMKRNDFDSSDYPLRFKDVSKNSKTIIGDPDYKTRVISFVIGIMWMCAMIFI